MATIAIGDVHGNLQALQDLVNQLRTEINTDDAVVFLGDYIDRGLESKECVDAILTLRAERSADVICLCGNHEDWFLRTLRDPTAHTWLLGMDGFATIRSYSEQAERVLRRAAAAAGKQLYEGNVALPYEMVFDAMPPAHRQFFEGLARHHWDEHGIYVHAGLDSRRSLSDQTREAVTFGWDDDGFPDTYSGDQMVLYGHRNNAIVDARGWPAPRRSGRTIGLDTSRHGVLTAMRLPDQHVFQSRRFEPQAG